LLSPQENTVPAARLDIDLLADRLVRRQATTWVRAQQTVPPPLSYFVATIATEPLFCRDTQTSRFGSTFLPKREK
jgi:hypothetical protein